MIEIDAEWENLDEAFSTLEAECTDIVRGITVEVFWNTLKMSPQYFGRFASSWTYRIGSPEFRSSTDFDYESEDQGYAEIFRKGSVPAIESALKYNKGRDANFKLGDTVYISNGVNHGEGSYAQGIEDGSIYLRPVNMPGRPLGRAIDIASSWYGNEVHESHVGPLKRIMRLY